MSARIGGFRQAGALAAGLLAYVLAKLWEWEPVYVGTEGYCASGFTDARIVPLTLPFVGLMIGLMVVLCRKAKGKID